MLETGPVQQTRPSKLGSCYGYVTVIFIFGIKSYVTTFAVQFTISQAGIAAQTLTQIILSLKLASLPEP